MEIADWYETPRPIVSKTRAQRRFLSPTVIGFIGTLLIHVLILPTAYFGIYGTKVRPRAIQEPGAFANSNDDLAESLVLITLPTTANSNQEITQSISSLATLSKLKPYSPVNPDPPAFLNLEVLTLGDEQTSKSTVDGGDATELARLFGIYSGQIQARINRIWLRPRSPVNEDVIPETAPGDGSFQCQAQIVQDAKGNVQEILLLRCNGSPAWQRSLVVAIQQASPLPAPPSVSVFSHSVTLNFLGLSYMPGSVDDDYDIAPAKVAQTNLGSPRSADSLNPSKFRRPLSVAETLGSRQ
jgi:hypothetical protein